MSSAPNINNVILVGQLTADPELRSLPDGRSVCDLRLAVNDRRDKPPTFVDVAAFGEEADRCAEHLAKGRQVGVVGRLIYSEWEKDGAKRSKHSVVGRISFGGKSDDVPAGEEEGARDE